MRPPRRTSDPAEAVEISACDGVCVLTSLAKTNRTAADRLPRTLWGDGLTGWLAPAEIRNTGEREVLTLGKENGQAHLTNQHRRGAHTDSFKSHGPSYSDFFLLLFARASSQGGESFAVDGYRMVAALSAHPTTAPLMALLPTRPVVQINIAVSSGGVVERVGPLCGWGPAVCKADVQPFGARARQRSDGRFQCQICHDARAVEGDTHVVETNEMLYVFYKAVRLVEASAQRFRVESSELLIFDNWRVMHGREPCECTNDLLSILARFDYNCSDTWLFAVVGDTDTELERQLWRVWCWTNRGAPDVPDEASLEQPASQRLQSV
eukprot:COSAG02_NODE_1549_length_11966_cov_3.777282_11_plen_323_part_00